MKIILFLIFLSPVFCEAQKIEVSWNDNFQKEIRLTCAPEDFFCEKICSASSVCYLEEGLCRSCIGTGLKMHHIFSEIGRSIRRQEQASTNAVAEFLLRGDFVSFMARDVFNLIDTYNSVSVYEKFASLCPAESTVQVLFLSTDHITRRPLRPEYVYCEFAGEELYFKVEEELAIERSSVPSEVARPSRRFLF